MKELKPEETQLVGKLLRVDSRLIENETSKRIKWLIQNHLKKITQDSTGWIVLFEDPNDKRYWELSYPESELHGGGQPMLTNISEQEARSKYQW